MPFIKPKVMDRQTILLAPLIALGAVLVTGLVVVPIIKEADARSNTASERNKVQELATK
jgi:hypothetical protein